MLTNIIHEFDAWATVHPTLATILLVIVFIEMSLRD